jgi:hypothetical protein
LGYSFAKAALTFAGTFLLACFCALADESHTTMMTLIKEIIFFIVLVFCD